MVRKEKTYKNLVLDIGNVLVENRYIIALQDFGCSSETASLIYDEMFRVSGDLWDLYDRGKIRRRELMKAYERRYPEYAKEMKWLIGSAEKYNLYFPDLYQVLKEVHDAGYRIYLLSNYPEEYFHNLEEKRYLGEVLEKVDGAIVSYRVNLTKPNRKIYHALYRNFSLCPRESIFFDDRKVNTDAAKNTGMDAVCVKSPMDFKDLLIREFLDNSRGYDSENK